MSDSTRRTTMTSARWTTTALAALLGALGAPGAAIAQDVIDAGNLRDGGVVLEAEADRGAIRDLAGLGDVNGDGFDDIGLSGYVPQEDGQFRWHFSIVHGRPAFTGRWRLQGLSGATVFRSTQVVHTGR